MSKTERVVRLFGEKIVQGEFKEGAALPSEAKLCDLFQVSRNCMRESIKVLVAKRLIDSCGRRGLFVMSRNRWDFLDAEVLEWTLASGNNNELIFSLLEVRNLIEPTILSWAASRANSADLAAIDACWSAMEASKFDHAEFKEAQIRLNKAMLMATHNPVITQLSEAFGVLQRKLF